MRAIAFLFLLAPSLAYAQDTPRCLPAEEMRDKLLSDFGESIVSQGIMQDGRLHLVFATDDGSSWTVVVVDPQTRQACIAVYGADYQARRAEPVESPL